MSVEVSMVREHGACLSDRIREKRGVIVSRDITDRKKSEEALEAIVKSTVSPGNPHFFQNLVQQLAQPLRVPMVLLAERVNHSGPSSSSVGAMEYRPL